MADFDRSRWLQELLDVVLASDLDDKTKTAIGMIFQYAEPAIALHHCMPGGKIADVKVNRVNIKPDNRIKGKTMLVVAGIANRLPVVTFHSGDSGIQLFRGFLQRAAAGSLKWTADSPLHAVEVVADEDPLPTLPTP